MFSFWDGIYVIHNSCNRLELYLCSHGFQPAVCDRQQTQQLQQRSCYSIQRCNFTYKLITVQVLRFTGLTTEGRWGTFCCSNNNIFPKEAFEVSVNKSKSDISVIFVLNYHWGVLKKIKLPSVRLKLTTLSITSLQVWCWFNCAMQTCVE